MQFSLSRFGLVRIGVATPELRVADVDFNRQELEAVAVEAADRGCRLLVLPELALTGYTCGDLFLQQALLDRAESALLALAAFTRSHPICLAVGLPIRQGGRLFNAAAFLAGGAVLGVVPKSYLPGSAEFYEERWFAAAAEAVDDRVVLGGQPVPFGTDLLFVAEDLPGAVIGIEICEDVWVAEPPSGALALAGATLLLNLSASPEMLGKEGYRRALVQSQSARCLAAYAYASAGVGESSTDLVYSGHSLIAESGAVLAETERFRPESQYVLADVDVARLELERRRLNSFSAAPPRSCRRLSFQLGETADQRLLRSIPPHPFVPERQQERDGRCREIFALQTAALAKRLRHTGSRTVVIGVSGGLDSTLALLVVAKAFDQLCLDRQGVLAVTMPGFGTTDRTRGNAERLAEKLGVTLRTIPIAPAVEQHFHDIGHDPAQHDITYENAQARERTQLLMDLANREGGLVIGTGDLSELALGWCTYNGDHMSMYAVNVGVPKTLVRYLVEWCAQVEFSGETAAVLHDICATPVSPELLPPDEGGEIAQRTEDELGPYELHDFFLYQVVRLHQPPAKVFLLARLAFEESYRPGEILRWLRLFYRRFFASQFKRSCLPDGPKIGSVVLSPRGDWRMPSDASAQLWLTELERLEAELPPAERA